MEGDRYIIRILKGVGGGDWGGGGGGVIRPLITVLG